MNSRVAVGAARFIFALVELVSLVARYIWGLDTASFAPGNFFAYLTIQSNIAFMVVCVVGGIVALKSTVDPPWLTNLHAVVLSWILVAGIVFAILVQQAGERGFRLEVPWSDQVLHFWLPAFALLEWIISRGRGRSQWRMITLTVGYPVIWGGITLVRGAVVGWYPYFFLDPDQVTDPFEFVTYSSIALLTFAVTSTGVISLARLKPVAERVSARTVRASVEQS
ncbi:Pr6Pr family membrane protein [Conyzicola nivalis]|uniref:Pr6Pr family membrane protein n=1 Tax=Conyzicola nivalis TaxID=1477021 RepID=UPI0016632E8C|nr:Pr6Pr family membrane protein [Conyzicola nivalis]